MTQDDSELVSEIANIIRHAKDIGATLLLIPKVDPVPLQLMISWGPNSGGRTSPQWIVLVDSNLSLAEQIAIAWHELGHVTYLRDVAINHQDDAENEFYAHMFALKKTSLLTSHKPLEIVVFAVCNMIGPQSIPPSPPHLLCMQRASQSDEFREAKRVLTAKILDGTSQEFYVGDIVQQLSTHEWGRVKSYDSTASTYSVNFVGSGRRIELRTGIKPIDITNGDSRHKPYRIS